MRKAYSIDTLQEQVNPDIDSSVDSLKLMMEEEERKKRMFRQRNLEHNSLNGTFTCFSVVLCTFEFYRLDPASKPDYHMLLSLLAFELTGWI